MNKKIIFKIIGTAIILLLLTAGIAVARQMVVTAV
jgi:hypothetical protein